MDDSRKSRPRNPEMLRQRSHGVAHAQIAVLENVRDQCAWMRWIEHSHNDLLVVILIIDEHRIPGFKCKRQTPIAADAHRPESLQFTAQSVTFPARHLHILDTDRLIQNVKLHRKPRCMLRLNPRLRSRLKELLNAFMPEALDHKTIVYRDYTPRAMKLLDSMNHPFRTGNLNPTPPAELGSSAIAQKIPVTPSRTCRATFTASVSHPQPTLGLKTIVHKLSRQLFRKSGLHL